MAQRTKHLEVVALETNGLVHVLEQPARRRDEDVHPRQTFSLVLEVLPANYQTRRKAMVSAYASQHFEYLDGLAWCWWWSRKYTRNNSPVLL